VGKWTAPLGTKVELLQVSAQISPGTLIDALLDATIYNDRADYAGYSLFQATGLEVLAAAIRKFYGEQKQ
jgi:hypothetical protein